MHRLQQTILIRRRHETQERKKHKLRRSFSAFGKGLSLVISLIVVLAILLGSFEYIRLTKDLPSLDQIQRLLDPVTGTLLQPTQIYDRTGNTVIATLDNYGIPRQYLYLDPDKTNHFSAQFISAMVFTLQPDFWSTPGFSLKELNNPQPVTIAEKLVDSLLLETEPASLRRTIRMKLLAAQLVSRYGRVQVLEWFLNSAYFGHLAYGADTASQLYLGKSAQDINLAESALLVAAYQAPALNPLDAPAAALEYQKSLLWVLHTAGFISDAEFTNAQQASLQLKTSSDDSDKAYSAFIKLVVNQASSIMGKKTIERGGVKIISSLDLDLQKQAECVLLTQMLRASENIQEISTIGSSDCEAASLLTTLPDDIRSQGSTPLGSVVILDNITGQILALTGDMDENGVSHAIQKHQTGTLLTPVVAVAAFSRGMSPATLLWDIPSTSSDEASNSADETIVYHGPVRLRTALVNDYIHPFTQLMDQIGVDTVWKSTEPLGLTSMLKEEVGSEALYEGQTLDILEAAFVYSTFADLGMHHGLAINSRGMVEPAAIVRITSSDERVIYAPAQPDSQQVLSAPIAYLVHNMLSDETARWKQYGHPNVMEIGKEAGVKVGVTRSGDEVWTVGYTPHYLVASWFGNAENQDQATQLDYRLAAGVWNALIQYASQDEPSSQWTAPSGIAELEVCDPSGELATNICPVIVKELFLSGTEPAGYDTLYQNILVNRETGRLATVFTPLELVQEQTFMVVPEQAKGWAAAAGIAQPPVEYDTIQTPIENPDVTIAFPAMFAYVHGEIKVTGTAAGEGFQSYSLQIGEGLNPTSWQEIGSGSSRVKNKLLGTWKTEQDGLYAMRLVVVREDQQLDTAIIQISVDNTPPGVTILYPTEGMEFSRSKQEAIFLQVNVVENVQVDTIRWIMDGKQIAETSGSLTSVSWTPVAGKHELEVEVKDAAGNVSSSKINFIVNK
ncbi:MAG: transglycosylase domain-containing protein [Anaerolineaceae bacterium]